MNRRIRLAAVMLLALLAAMSAVSAFAAPSASRITEYRVYQNGQALREFASQQQAIAYARGYRNSHVEKITTRAPVWDNFPRYQVYRSGLTAPELEFRTFGEALKAARTLNDVHIRDLEQPGWVYSRHANYQLFQGDKTMLSWRFATLAEAKNAAKRWSRTHIIDLGTNRWIWDNLSEAEEAAERKKTPVYDIFIDGVSAGGKTYAYLRDAIAAASSVAGSEVVNTSTATVVHSTIPPYSVVQNGRERKRFFSLNGAAAYAKGLANAQILSSDGEWWTNLPYLRVYQGERHVRSFHTLRSALAYASTLENAGIVTEDGRKVWSNTRKLAYLGWNGSSSGAAIEAQVANTQGLDIVSPGWFALAAADGTLEDKSDPAVLGELVAKGKSVMPLVHNGFDTTMTSEFLANPSARQSFVDSLAARLSAIGAAGVNLDFEAIAAKDRASFTAFVKQFAEVMHAKGLRVSIDLPRGDLAWNYKTAYDIEQIAGYVDIVVIMAYDQHWKGSESPGSVSGLKWTEDGILDYLSYGIPRSKIMLGVPLYIRVWRLDGNGKLVGSSALLMKEVPSLLASVDAAASYDPAYGQTKYKYVKEGFTYVLWAETPATIQARLALAKKHDLAGVAFWRLGYEDAELWTSALRQK